MNRVKLKIPGVDKPISLYLHEEREDCLSEYIRDRGIWEPYETSLVVDLLKRGDVFLDIGANIGYYTVLASVIVGEEGLVAAYEPDPDNYRLLRMNVEANCPGNVVSFQAAVADFDGSAKIHLSKDNMGDHRLYDHDGSVSSRAVRVVNGGDHLSEVTGRIDFMKIDTQGFEASVLKGLKRQVSANADHLVIMTEFWPHGLRGAGASGREFLDLLDSFGMRINVIDHINGRVVPTDARSLCVWVDDVDSDPQNEGFINLLVLPRKETAR